MKWSGNEHWIKKNNNKGMRREAIVREVSDYVERNGVERWIIEVIQTRMEPSILSC